MSYKTVDTQISDGDIFKFEEEGQAFEGVLTGIRRQVTTKMGLADIADFDDMEGEPWAIFITAGLKSSLRENLIGGRLLITYQGKEKNPNTGREFKKFTVGLWSGDE